MNSNKLSSYIQAIAKPARPVWLVSIIAAVVAAVATELYGLVARAVGIPMEAGGSGADTASAISVGMFAMATFIAMIWATILVVAIARFARSPATTFLRTAVVLAVLTLAGPLAAGATATSTKIMLCGAHVLAAFIVIPILTQRLAHVSGDRQAVIA